MKIKLPTALIECIDTNILKEKEFFQINVKQRQILNQNLIHLWYIIYSSQIDDSMSRTLDCYTNIPRDNFKFIKFNFRNNRYEYNKLLQYLHSWELIDINDKYCYYNDNYAKSDKSSFKPFAKSYKIKTKFLKDTKMTEVEIDFKKIFKKTKNKEFWMEKYPNYTSMIEDCYNVTIKLDEFASWLYNNEGKKLNSKLKNGIMNHRFLTPERIIMYINKVLKIHFKNLWFKISDEGRFYSSLTNLPSECIKFLRLKGKEVVELDAKNCQPLLLASLINDLAYKNDVENGIFYDKMAESLGWERLKFKIYSYKHLFFSNNILKSGEIYNTLNDHYPGLVEQINNLKKEIKLALKLQQLESNIFVENIGKLPYCKITRHDSVLVFKENYDDFEKCIEEGFSKLDLRVTIK